VADSLLQIENLGSWIFELWLELEELGLFQLGLLGG
jgi:hypothetical protein